MGPKVPQHQSFARCGAQPRGPTWLPLILACVAQVGWLVVFYGSFIAPQIISVTEREIVLPTKEPLTIVVLSDFHVGPYKGQRFVRRVVAKVNEINPDLVLLAGDYVYYESDPLDSLQPLKDLHPRYGVFGVLGNHEYGCYQHSPLSLKGGWTGADHSLPIRRALERSNVTVLRNEWREITLESKEGTEGKEREEGKKFLYVSGVDDTCSKRDAIKSALPDYRTKSPLILISHSPDIILDGDAKRFNLIVAGHTHAGQIRLPFIGPLTSLPTELGRAYDQGLFSVDKNTTLAITRGIGESGPRARLFAPPEILVLRVKAS